MTCRYKARFESWESANEAIERLIHNRNFRSYRNYVMTVYFCQGCNCFHIGHTAKVTEERKRREDAKIQKLICRYIS